MRYRWTEDPMGNVVDRDMGLDSVQRRGGD